MDSSLSLTSSIDFNAEVGGCSAGSFSENSTELAHRMDARALEAVVGTHRKVQILNLLIKLGVVAR